MPGKGDKIMSEYEITLKQEVMREMGAEVTALYFNYMDKHGISSDDEKNPVVIMDKDAVSLWNEIIPKYNTLEDLRIAEGRFRQLKSFIEQLERYNEQLSG